jgi:hypothetical protein
LDWFFALLKVKNGLKKVTMMFLSVWG